MPTEDALTVVRRRRDDAWQQLRRGQACDEPLAAAFESALRQADELADRLRREADRVAERARLAADRTRFLAEREGCRARRARLEERRADARARWSALWSAIGITEPASPVEMRGWLRRQAELATLARGVREQHVQIAALEGQIAAHRRGLHAALAALGVSTDDDESLSDRIERSTDAVDQIKTQAAERKRHRQDVESLDAERPALDAAAAAAAEEWDRWQAAWVEAVRPLGLAASAPPSAAHAVMDRSKDLFERLDHARTLRQEIAATAREAERFAADARALARRVAPDLAPPAEEPPSSTSGSSAAAPRGRITST